MHKLMCTFMTPMKKMIPDRNLDTSCPAGIPCKKQSKAADEDSWCKNFARILVLNRLTSKTVNNSLFV